MSTLRARLRSAPSLIALSSFALFAPPALAQQPDIDIVRREMREMREMRRDYEKRIQELENRLTATEASRAAPAAGPPSATAPAPGSLLGSPPTGAEQPAYAQPTSAFRSARQATSTAAFNPAIGAVLNGRFSVQTRDPGAYAIPGFALSEEAQPAPRGWSLGESELNAQANVDQWLFGSLTLAFESEGGAAVEEAYLQTTSLPAGFTAKAGRFFSGIGYMNEQHAHVWDFIDPALPYRAFFGPQYGDDGVQIRWLAPTDLFLEFGAEAFRGDAFPAGGAAHHGLGSYSAFVHAGDDIGVESSWRAGASYFVGNARGRVTNSDMDTFTGQQQIGILDAVFKWAPDGNPAQRNLKLQGEFFYGSVNGQFNGPDFSQSQWGWYAQAIYQFMPRWRVGARYDMAEARGVASNPFLMGSALDDLGKTAQRASAMIDYSTSEFGRFRLQYNRDESAPQVDHQVFLQYVVSIGAHGAHQF